MRSVHSVTGAVALAVFATTLMNAAACAAISGYWHNDRDAWFVDARADGAPSGDLDVFAMTDGGQVGVRYGAGDHPGGLDTVRAATGCEGSWLPGFGRPGMEPVVHAIVVFDDGSGPALFASGLFTRADGVPAGRLAKWQACPAVQPCPTDLDGHGTVGMSDLLVLPAAWEPCPACDPDLSGDGVVEFSDVLILLAAWGECP
ncbi:MAG: hypothetical protein KF817_03175 [Phycisphaeraceae bacterium]|nr:hypothetical protein [Phycisphaeraceae bacterium]